MLTKKEKNRVLKLKIRYLGLRLLEIADFESFLHGILGPDYDELCFSCEPMDDSEEYSARSKDGDGHIHAYYIYQELLGGLHRRRDLEKRLEPKA